MGERNGYPTRSDAASNPEKTNRETRDWISRRRWLQLAGAGIVGGSLAAGRVGAATGTHRLEIVAADNVEYRFSTTGEITKVLDNGNRSAEANNDAVAQNADGSWTAEGLTGNGYGDTFDFVGSVTGFEVLVGACTIYLDGTEVTVEELTSEPAPTRRLEIVAADNVEYAFTATGAITKVLDNGDRSAEANNDAVAQNADGSWTAEGLTGNGYGDTFEFRGEAVSFDVLAGACTLYLDGTEVTVEQLTGQTPPTTEEPTDEVQPDHRLEIVAPEHVEYVLSTSGEISKVLDNGNRAAEADNDAVTENADGSWTAEGLTGGGYGDTYDFVGDATAFEKVAGDCVLYLDGVEVTVEELTGQEPTDDTEADHTLEIVAPDDLHYAFTADGEITKVLDNGDRSAESSNDTVTENGDGSWTAEGRTGNGYGDTFDFVGEPVEFEPKQGNFALYLDGTQVTAYELVGEEPPADTGSTPVDGGPIGGGAGYPNTVARDAADVVVSTRGELRDALSSAGRGDVVYVAGNASIDMGGSEVTVPAGATLASNRGIDDAPGGQLYTNEETRMIHLSDDARVTGLRIQGPFWDWIPYEPYKGGQGVRAANPGVEIDNCEISGFAYASIGGTRHDAHVHHNDIHHNSHDGTGYGIDCINGHPLIEWNYFNHNRHSIAASGDGGYTARYNHFGPEIIDAPIDCHSPGGVRIEVYRNTVEGVESATENRRWPAVSIRGVPDDVCTVHDNWFYNPTPPRDTPDMWTDEAIIQVHVDEWTNMEWEDNHYGSSEPSTDVGHPR